MLEACQSRGLLYADDRLNAVFVCRNASGHTTGAEILGTAPQTGTRRFRGMAPGSRKACGGFWLPCGRNRPAVVILTESAVDAISARSLRIEGIREHGAVRRFDRRHRQRGTALDRGLENRSASSVHTTPTAPVTLPQTGSPSTIRG